MTKVDIASVSISAFLKSAALDWALPRGARRPNVNQQLAVQLLAEIGRLSTAFHGAVEAADGIAPQAIDTEAIETALRDQSEMRLILFEALGQRP